MEICIDTIYLYDTYICIHVSVFYTYVYTYIYIYSFTHTYMYMHVFIHVCIHLCLRFIFLSRKLNFKNRDPSQILEFPCRGS